MVSPIKSRPNSRRNSSDFYIPCLPQNQWMQLLLKISPAFWYGKIVKGKRKFTFQRANCSEPNKLVVVNDLLRCQQGQWTALLVNFALCLSILDENESGMNSWVLAIHSHPNIRHCYPTKLSRVQITPKTSTNKRGRRREGIYFLPAPLPVEALGFRGWIWVQQDLLHRHLAPNKSR